MRAYGRLCSLFASVPQSRNDYRITSMIDAIANDIRTHAKRNDQLSIAGPCRRTTAFRKLRQRVRGSKQCVDRTLRERCTMRFQESSQPFEIGACARQEDDLHGSGGGSSFVEP